MIEGRIIHLSKRMPDGKTADWFEIETVHGGKPHRSRDHSYKTEADARAAASKECDTVDDALYEERG